MNPNETTKEQVVVTTEFHITCVVDIKYPESPDKAGVIELSIIPNRGEEPSFYMFRHFYIEPVEGSSYEIVKIKGKNYIYRGDFESAAEEYIKKEFLATIDFKTKARSQ